MKKSVNALWSAILLGLWLAVLVLGGSGINSDEPTRALLGLKVGVVVGVYSILYFVKMKYDEFALLQSSKDIVQGNMARKAKGSGSYARTSLIIRTINKNTRRYCPIRQR